MKNSRRSFISKAAIAAAMAPFAAASTFAQEYETAVDRTPKASPPSNLKITEVKCGYIRGSLFVKIYTNQDIWGCGEGVDAVPGTYHLVKNFGQRITGRSPLNVHRLFEDIRKSGFFQGAQSGMYVAVLSAVEAALWDLAGKALQLPVYQLLGGKFRDKVRVYCDTALYQTNLPTAAAFAEAATNAKKMGFNAIKFDLDQANDPNKYDRYNWTASPAELQRMYDQLAAAREAVGPAIDICADMHGRYDAVTAQAIAKRVEPLNLMWLEEPIPPENIDTMREITNSTSTPICAGENLYLRHGFRDLIEKHAVDIIMPDIPKCGGLSECRKIANMAELYSMPFAPHNVASPIGTMASAHVCATVPNFLVLEFHWHHRDFWSTITDGGNIIKGGKITMTDKPGIGLELNYDVAKEHQYPGTTWFE
jgi:galactonate dehydratase